MCGIVGYVGPKQASPILIDGLRRMEYRGYDSAGVAVINGDGIKIKKAAGKLSSLVEKLRTRPPHGTVGIGHTRWATHGAPTTPNAHPHLDQAGKIAVIHNGIIENAPVDQEGPGTSGATPSPPRPIPKSWPTSSATTTRATSRRPSRRRSGTSKAPTASR